RKSDRIGRRIRLPREVQGGLRRATAIRWATVGKGKRGEGRAPRTQDGDAPTRHHDEAGGDSGPLARLLRWGGERGEPAEGTILWAPLQHDGELLGLLKIAARRPGALGAPEAASVERVVRHLASVIHNARRALSMEERILEAEKKHAMADLARAISHDGKNANRAILPLAQQGRNGIEGVTSK